MKFNLPDSVERLLAPPAFADEEATLRAGLLNTTRLATAAFLALMLVYRLIAVATLGVTLGMLLSGRIWAEGQVNQGATFYFTLPAEG